MQALVYTAPNHVEIHDQPQPRPADGRVVVRVKAAGICGSDVDGFLGHSRKRKPPLVMGHEFSAVLQEDMPEKGLAAGDEVAVLPLLTCGSCRWCRAGHTNRCPNRLLIGMDMPGAFADFVSIPRDSVYAMPDGLTTAGAILAEPLANGFHVVGLAGGTLPDTAVVLGCGTIGMMVIKVLSLGGCSQIIATDTNPDKFPAARATGATAAVQAGPQAAEGIREICPDPLLVIDCIGVGQTRALGIDVLVPGGTFLWIGQNNGEMAGEARDIVAKELTIRGSYAYTRHDFERALSALAGPAKDLESLVSYEPLNSGQQVFEDLVHAPGDRVKVALVPPASELAFTAPAGP